MREASPGRHCPRCGEVHGEPTVFRQGIDGVSHAHLECPCGVPLTWPRDDASRGRWRVDEGAVRHRRQFAALRRSA